MLLYFKTNVLWCLHHVTSLPSGIMNASAASATKSRQSHHGNLRRVWSRAGRVTGASGEDRCVRHDHTLTALSEADVQVVELRVFDSVSRVFCRCSDKVCVCVLGGVPINKSFHFGGCASLQLADKTEATSPLQKSQSSLWARRGSS